MFRDQARLEGAFAIARDVDRQRPVVGQHRLVAGPVAMIGRLLGLGATRRVAEVMRQFAAQRPLDDRLLEPPDGGLELLRGEAALGERIEPESRRGQA